jgi:hypothetical protein
MDTPFWNPYQKRIDRGTSIVEMPTLSLDTTDKEVWTPMQIGFPFVLKLLSLRKSLMLILETQS